MEESPYLLDNRRDEAGERFDALAALYDPVTIRHFHTLGVGDGWRCLEVGAGGGSVVRHLADRVGTSGRVLATDIEPRFLEPLRDLANVDVARHDVAVDPLPEAEFDLIHARLVLVHVAGDGYLPISEKVRLLERANTLQLQEPLLGRQIISKEEFEHFIALLDDPSFAPAGIFPLSAWGRTPA